MTDRHTPEFRVAILGASLDVGNRGVLALAASVASLVVRIRPNAKLAFHYGHVSGGSRLLAGNPPHEITVNNCRLSTKSSPSTHIGMILLLAVLYRVGVRRPALRNAWVKSLTAAHVIGDIRGGDSFSDIYGVGKFVVGSLPLMSAALLGRPYIMLPQTYGPFKSPISKWLATRLLRSAAQIWTRDVHCVAPIERLSSRTVRFCPDVAFTLEPTKPASASYRPHAMPPEAEGPLIGMNVSGLLYVGGYSGRNMFGLQSDYRTLMDLVADRLLSSTDCRLLILPHTFGSEQEEEACSAVFDKAVRRHPGRVFMLASPLSEREIKWTIGQVEFFVGARMHACIAAISQCIATVGLGYSDKFLGVFESAGVSEFVVDLRQADEDDVIRRVTTAFARRLDTAKALGSRIPAIEAQVVEAFRELMSQSASD